MISVIIQNFAAGLISYLGHACHNFHPLFLFIFLYCLMTLAMKFFCGHRQCDQSSSPPFDVLYITVDNVDVY